MRKIKFRAFHKEQGCMYYTQPSTGTEGDGWIESIDFEAQKIQLGCQSDNGDYVKWFPFSVIELMQYTEMQGYKKHKKQEIYEGDIVKRGEGPDEIGEIKKGYGLFYCIFGNAKDNAMPKNCESYEWEVIGNIYENNY